MIIGVPPQMHPKACNLDSTTMTADDVVAFPMSLATLIQSNARKQVPFSLNQPHILGFCIGVNVPN